MSRDLMTRLRELPPELPDAPDRLRRVHELATRKRRIQLVAVASSTAIVIATPVALAVTLSDQHSGQPHPTGHATVPASIARSCSKAGFEIASLPPSRRVSRTAAQALAALKETTTTAASEPTVFPAIVRSPIAMKLGLGPAGAPRTTWVVYQIVTVPRAQHLPGNAGVPVDYTLAGTRIARVRFVDDVTLKSAGGVSCEPVSATAGNVGFGIADGTRVSVTGLVAPAGSGYVVCFQGGLLDGRFTGPTCDDQVALIGDPQITQPWSRKTREIRGTWVHDAIEVASLGPPQYEDRPLLATPPCPTPKGGWAQVAPSKTPNLDLAPFEHYRSTHRGIVTAIAQFRPTNLTPVLTIASTYPESTRTALQDAYPRALCVVQSRYSADQVRAARADVERAFDARQLPGVYGFGSGVSSEGQPTEDLEALSDQPQLHQALPEVPADMLVIHPWIRQPNG